MAVFLSTDPPCTLNSGAAGAFLVGLVCVDVHFFSLVNLSWILKMCGVSHGHSDMAVLFRESAVYLNLAA